MHTTEAHPLALAVNAIERQGYAIMDDYLSSSNMAALATIVKEKWFAGQMVSAKTGKAALKNQTIRGDFIAWLDENDSQPAVQAYFRQMELLRLMLNMQLLMNVQSLETHVVVYPVGSVYQKHLDQFNSGATAPTERQFGFKSKLASPSWQRIEVAFSGEYTYRHSAKIRSYCTFLISEILARSASSDS